MDAPVQVLLPGSFYLVGLGKRIGRDGGIWSHRHIDTCCHLAVPHGPSCWVHMAAASMDMTRPTLLHSARHGDNINMARQHPSPCTPLSRMNPPTPMPPAQLLLCSAPGHHSHHVLMYTRRNAYAPVSRSPTLTCAWRVYFFLGATLPTCSTLSPGGSDWVSFSAFSASWRTRV